MWYWIEKCKGSLNRWPGKIWLGSSPITRRLANHMRRQKRSSPLPNQKRAIPDSVSPSTTWCTENQPFGIMHSSFLSQELNTEKTQKGVSELFNTSSVLRHPTVR